MRNVFWLLPIFLSIGCASFNPSFGILSFGQEAQLTNQTLEGTTLIDTFVVFPIGPSLDTSDDMGLKIGRISLNGDLTGYCFIAEVHTGNWIFADNISIKIDDDIYRLHDNNPNHLIWSGKYVIETTTYSISAEMLEALRNAKTLSAELYRRVVSLDEKNLQKVKDFLQ
jgi:hypothetical protein